MISEEKKEKSFYGIGYWFQPVLKSVSTDVDLGDRRSVTSFLTSHTKKKFSDEIR